VDMPWQALTAAGGGWALAIAVMWRTVNGYITGTTVTRREADSIEKRADTAEKLAATLAAQNSELMEMTKLAKHSFRSLGEGADR
jgi:hypothetical protein